MKRLFIWSPLVLCYVISCNSQTTISIEESLSDQTDFLSDPDESESLPSLFKASKDAFLKASAFNFGQAWFKIRGYDSRYGKVTINGLEMNKWHDHRPQWSNWGGLNDIFKPFQFSFGLEPANHTFGDILGSTNFEVRASSFRPMKKLSLAS
jgi:hypothetical protein